MSKKQEAVLCNTCAGEIAEPEKAAVLTMGHYGIPRLICPNCEKLINTAERSHDPNEAEAAMARLGELVSNTNKEDTAVHEAIEEIFTVSAKRAEAIRRGEYDFSLDEESDDSFDEIPEELLETEEDKQKTEQENETNRKFNKVMDIVTAIVFVGALVMALIYFLKR